MTLSNSIVSTSDRWEDKFPDAFAGALLIRDIINVNNSSSLSQKRAEVEQAVQKQFSGFSKEEIKSIPIIKSYQNHYKKFGKTYHVRLQLESIILKGKSNSNPNGIVEAMFIAEMKNLLLTACHDLTTTKPPVVFDASIGQEIFTTISGQPQQLKPLDMIMRDSGGVICSVIYGPDSRTRVQKSTRDALYAVYAPAGIKKDQIFEHLKDIQTNVLLFSPDAKTELLEVY
ncbi:hypothetical protein ACFLZP_04315 [Patescibacteria group bacterium]